MPRTRLPLLVLLALPVAACGTSEVPIGPEPVALAATPAPGQAGPASPAQGMPAAANGVLPAGAADKVLPVGSPPVVKLLEPGAEPRSDLSYALTKGANAKMAMSMDMTMAIKAKGQAMPAAKIPRMTMIFDTAAADRNPAGDFRIDSRLSGVSLAPNGGQEEQMARALQPQLDSMKGLGMSYWMNPKGQVRDVKLDMPSSMPPAAKQLLNGMSQSFESMVTPLPKEPVGVGGRWQVVSRMASGGADLLQSAIYTLKARNGSKATLEVALMQLAANDTIHGPQMPAGMSAKVKAFSSGGGGTTQVDLKSVAPDAGAMSLKVSMDIAVVGAGAGPGDESTVETTTVVQVSRP